MCNLPRGRSGVDRAAVPDRSFERPGQQPVERAPEGCVLDMLSGYCPANESVVSIVPTLAEVHQRIGDLATGTGEAGAELAAVGEVVDDGNH